MRLLLLIIIFSTAHAAVFTDTGNTGYCAGWGIQGQTPGGQTVEQCHAILDPVVENGGACMSSGSNPRITPAYATQAECENPANGDTCCNHANCDQACEWTSLTGDAPYNTIFEAGSCAFCTSSSLNSGSAAQYLAEASPSGDVIPPLDVISVDPGEVSTLDRARWTVASANCGSKFVLQTNGDTWGHTCKTCDRDVFIEKYSSSHGLEITTIDGVNRYTRKSELDNNKGVVHGKCCINPHHSVCAAMLSEYLKKCEGEGGQTKGSGVHCLGTSTNDYACTFGYNNQICENGGTPTGTCAWNDNLYACTGCSCVCTAGYSGPNCGTGDACTAAADGNVCQNGGTVIGTTGSCGCSCATGFSGDNCEIVD